MTQSEYARHRQVSAEAVRQAIAAKRITPIERDGRLWIDPDVADIQWAKNTRARRDQIEKAAERRAPTAPAISVDAELYDFAAAKAKREHHEANLAAMREAEKAAALLDRAGVEQAAQDAGALMVQAMERLPPRLGDILAAESDPVRVRAVLSEALADALRDFADACEQLAGDGRA